MSAQDGKPDQYGTHDESVGEHHLAYKTGEGVITRHREAGFAARGLNPATPLYITVEDRLRITVVTSIAGVEVDVALRLQLANGQVIPMRQQLFPTSTRTLNTFDFDLSEGFLLDLSAQTPTAAVRVGGCFVVAQIIRGNGANAVPSRTLVSNYVTTGLIIGWPEGPNSPALGGAGLVRSVQVSNPAAGADWSVTVPTGARWQLQAVFALFVTSATVATRQVQLKIADGGGNTLFLLNAATTQAASASEFYPSIGGVNPLSIGSTILGPIPDVAQYLQGFTIGSATASIQAGDQWSQISLCVVEWLEL